MTADALPWESETCRQADANPSAHPATTPTTRVVHLSVLIALRVSVTRRASAARDVNRSDVTVLCTVTKPDPRADIPVVSGITSDAKFAEKAVGTLPFTLK